MEDGITFEEQTEIDNFAINYPGCKVILGDVVLGTEISALTDLSGIAHIEHVEGSFTINVDSISDSSMNGLANLSSIGGNLILKQSKEGKDFSVLSQLKYIGEDLLVQGPITTLIGLENLDSIGRTLRIRESTSLVDLEGLNGLTTVRSIYIWDNEVLQNLTALSNLNNITADTWTVVVSISKNPLLSSLEGFFENLTLINGSVSIFENNSLTSLEPLSNIEKIKHGFSIGYNNALVDLAGLKNLTSVNYFSIKSNPLLTDLKGLDSLVITGSLNIWENESLTSLSGLGRLRSAHGVLIENNPSLISLEGLEEFNEVRHYSFTIKNNNSLSDITALGSLSNIKHDLVIDNNSALIDLTGLENITTIKSLEILNNSNLINVEGLNNLATATDIRIENNASLMNLLGLENLASATDIHLLNNDNLVDLSALENLDHTSIDSLEIRDSESLSNCDAQVICDYLNIPGQKYWIDNNMAGCNNAGEIGDACGIDVSIEELPLVEVGIAPNPVYEKLKVSVSRETQLRIYNQLGILQKKIDLDLGATELDLSDLQLGLYFFQFENGKVQKVIKK